MLWAAAAIGGWLVAAFLGYWAYGSAELERAYLAVILEAHSQISSLKRSRGCDPQYELWRNSVVQTDAFHVATFNSCEVTRPSDESTYNEVNCAIARDLFL